MRRLLKTLLPDRDCVLPVIAGPFKGARFYSNPRLSMRKVFGLYERELNPWLRAVLPRVEVAYDVGANDGYFAFGCAHRFRRRGRGAVFAFEPEASALAKLRHLTPRHDGGGVRVEVVDGFVGDGAGGRTIGLDAWAAARSDGGLLDRGGLLLKIDVEGAEMDVLRGATRLLHPGNFVVVEVHSPRLLDEVTGQLAAAGLGPRTVLQAPPRLLGRERREVDNCWVVTAV